MSGCFHCGEPCSNADFAVGEKIFCCQGCLIVHDLLTESGLGRFYELGANPGIRSRPAATREQWAYLDEPILQQRLLDFTDGRLSRVTFHIPAIHCIACVWLLENLSRLNPGIIATQVNFPRREVAIRFAAGQVRLSEVVALLASIGYEPALTLGELEQRKTNPARRRQWLQIGLAGFAFGNVMLLSLPLYLGLDSFSAPLFKTVFGYLSLAFAFPVLVFSAADYWKSAWLAVRQRALTLDVPIALGLAAIYAQSVQQIVSGRGDGYLDSMCGLIFFLLCGRAFQQKTHERLAFDRDYKSFFPLSVRRVRPSQMEDGAPELTRAADAEESISLSQLQVGDRILVRNGELIPADATLASGNALIDYSFVTGESVPVARQVGDHLYAGGKQMGAAIEVETVKAVSQSYLTSLWNHDAFQKERDDNLNTLTNRYSRRFTLLVIAIALGSALFWTASGDLPRGIKAFISVLIVACPCALALAAPFTLGTAQRFFARAGIFLKNAIIIERMARVDAIVFDKTGTLTSATSSRMSFDGAPLDAAESQLVFALARQSTHPLSAQLTEELAGRAAAESVEAFVEEPGCGVAGKVRGHHIVIGSRAWIEAQTGLRRNADSAPLGSYVGVAIDGQYRGAFALSASLRVNTTELVRKLAAHYDLALLSGDNAREAELFRSLFGEGARLQFNQSPLDKLGFIQRLQESGRTVMMVGDGLNDAGALRQSDVGVAVVENVGAFSPGSDVILHAGNVARLFEILQLARRSATIVRASFAVSAIYNLVGIGIAAAGVLSPVVCAVLMPLSSVSVVVFACAVTAWSARRLLAETNPLAREARPQREWPAASARMVEVPS